MKNNNRVSNLAIIREMDADQLQEYAQLLFIKENTRGLEPEEQKELQACKDNYRQLTNQELTLQTIYL